MKPQHYLALALALGVAAAGVALALRGGRIFSAPGKSGPAQERTGGTPETGDGTGGKVGTGHNPVDPAGAKKATLRVYVHAGGTSVGDAVVYLVSGRHRSEGKTGPDGMFVAKDLAAGEWEVGVRHPRYMPVHEHADVADGAVADVAIQLQPGARIYGRATDDRGAVEGVRVMLLDPKSQMPIATGVEALTAKDGTYEIDGIPPATLVVYFVGPRHRPGRVDLRIASAGEVHQADAALRDANFISGRVLDESDAPIAEAGITASNEFAGSTKTDADGRFLFPRLGDGPVAVSVSAKGYGSVYLREVKPNTTDLVFRLPKVGRVAGRIVADELPEWIEVKLWRYDEYHQKDLVAKGFRFACRAKPKFLIEEVSPGTYTLTADAPGYEQEGRAVVTVERERTTVEQELRLRRK